MYSTEMELNLNFLAGLSCGLCLGISYFALKTFGCAAPKAKVIKKFTSHAESKMVLVVRTDIKLTKGTVMSQCCHAAVGAFEEFQKNDPKSLRRWQNSGQAKVAVKCNSLGEVNRIAEEAEKMGVATFKVFDEDTLTCVSVGPAPKDVIDKITGHLKLL